MAQVSGLSMVASSKSKSSVLINIIDMENREGTSGRALTTNMDTSPGGETNMTVANCVYSCQGAGYLLAGVEDSGQCFCGNQFSGQSIPAVDGFKGCNQPCQGNSSGRYSTPV